MQVGEPVIIVFGSITPRLLFQIQPPPPIIKLESPESVARFGGFLFFECARIGIGGVGRAEAGSPEDIQ